MRQQGPAPHTNAGALAGGVTAEFQLHSLLFSHRAQEILPSASRRTYAPCHFVHGVAAVAIIGDSSSNKLNAVLFMINFHDK